MRAGGDDELAGKLRDRFASGRWIVTGTTAASATTASSPVAASCRHGWRAREELGVTGMLEPGAIQHALGNGIGDDRAGVPGSDIGPPRDRIEASTGLRAAANPGVPAKRLQSFRFATTGSAFQNAALASSAPTSANSASGRDVGAVGEKGAIASR